MTNLKKLAFLIPLSSAIFLSGCVTADQQYYRSDTYTTNRLNQQQEVKAVDIIAILPAHVVIDTSKNDDTARQTGMVLGAIAGAALGSHNHHSTSSRVAGGVIGGVLGNMAGGVVSEGDRSYVEGVQLTYRLSNGKLFQSTQVGRACEYKVGTAILVSDGYDETRIQPNNPGACPMEVNK